ncbi:hypothetical protein VIGAN_08367800 [Vigna angularis var. angularis]|uniref:Uncharacterized protein n=1 Tax=Vigna angularis var. angularis TaxID=157739 RepID=A0A0S3SV27_PHAAN|nr:hypothetical protein VIGAN_08367800 [Vigna angularis var. angularis]
MEYNLPRTSPPGRRNHLLHGLCQNCWKQIFGEFQYLQHFTFSYLQDLLCALSSRVILNLFLLPLHNFIRD